MFNGILAISGKPGLFKLISQTKNGIIVEGIESKKRIPVYSTAKVSSLEDIAIYTYEEEIPLVNVLKSMSKIENFQESSVKKKAPASELKDYFEDIVPNYDKERVYVSDIQKVIGWYNILQKNDLLKFEENENENSNESIDTKESTEKESK